MIFFVPPWISEIMKIIFLFIRKKRRKFVLCDKKLFLWKCFETAYAMRGKSKWICVKDKNKYLQTTILLLVLRYSNIYRSRFSCSDVYSASIVWYFSWLGLYLSVTLVPNDFLLNVFFSGEIKTVKDKNPPKMHFHFVFITWRVIKNASKINSSMWLKKITRNPLKATLFYFLSWLRQFTWKMVQKKSLMAKCSEMAKRDSRGWGVFIGKW